MLGIEELRKETIEIFERTKKNMKKYEKERKELYFYYQNENKVNLEEWEAVINKIKNIIASK